MPSSVLSSAPPTVTPAGRTGVAVSLPRASTRFLAAAVAVYLCGSIVLGVIGYDTWPSLRLLGANLAGLFAIFIGLSCLGAGLLLARRAFAGHEAIQPGTLLAAESLRRAAGATIAVALFATLNATFWRYKNIIPDLLPFSWDPTLYRLDRLLHGGDPWAILHPLLGHPRITYLLGLIYGPGWVLVWMGTLTWVAWTANEALRRRYVVAYVLMWVLLGNVFATLLSSAGPTFFHEVVAGVPDPYAALRVYLAAALPFVISAQDAMWQANGMNPHPVLVPPISAAPSLHIALVSLNAMAISRVNRWLGYAVWAFAGSVFLATIHLGLHYAVDGYMAVAGVAAIWWAVERIGRRHSATQQMGPGR